MFEWNSVVVYSNCICSSASRCSLTMTVFIMFRIAWWTSAGKELTSWFSASVAFLYAVLIVCVPSRMASGEVCVIRLYRFLIIAFSST